MNCRWGVRLAALAAILFPSTIFAQLSEGGRFEIGALASYATFDAARNPFASEFGVGLRASWFVTRILSVEAITTRTVTQHLSDVAVVDIAELGATLLATFPAGGRHRVFVGAGASSLNHIGWERFSDQALHVIVGNRIPLSRMTALRVEARALIAPGTRAPGAADGFAVSYRFAMGLSLFARDFSARDADGDLVADRGDRCANSPRGTVVDAGGCPRDTDLDGVFDGVDRCLVTPQGIGVDARGCPSESDGDGVPDHLDRCASTEAGIAVDHRGCPLDRDSDGVADHLDRCADTPVGAAVSEAGCPLDSDSDGVPDYIDRCPNTSAGTEIDALGCQVLFVVKEAERQPLVLGGVTFELGSAVLTQQSFAVLEQIASSLKAYPDVFVEVAGHTDNQGTSALNLSLSLARAQSVRAFLVERGVQEPQLIARGYGAEQPVASNLSEDGRSQNRRVELRPLERNIP